MPDKDDVQRAPDATRSRKISNGEDWICIQLSSLGARMQSATEKRKDEAGAASDARQRGCKSSRLGYKSPAAIVYVENALCGFFCYSTTPMDAVLDEVYPPPCALVLFRLAAFATSAVDAVYSFFIFLSSSFWTHCPIAAGPLLYTNVVSSGSKSQLCSGTERMCCKSRAGSRGHVFESLCHDETCMWRAEPCGSNPPRR